MINKTFYIFRHAIATHSRKGYGEKIVTAKILPEGVPPIVKLATYLKNIESDYNVSSDYLRCRQTVKIIEETIGKHFVYDKRLDELYNETFTKFARRVKDFFDDMTNSTYRSIVICTHGAVINALKNFALEKTFDESQVQIDSDFGVLVIIKKGKIEEINFNLQ